MGLAFVGIAAGTIGISKISIKGTLFVLLLFGLLTIGLALAQSLTFLWPGFFGLTCECCIAGIVLFATRHHAQHACLIVCDAGMIELTNIYGTTRERILYWKNIQMILPWPFGRYALQGQTGQPFVISIAMYQHADELLLSLKEQIARTKQ
jgi:hypothetical protein